jgi:Tfp pilus assembly protein PilF
LFRLDVWFLAVCLVCPSLGGQRRIAVGDVMPEFSLTDGGGTTLRYGHQGSRVLGVVILQAGESHLTRLIADMETLSRKLSSETAGFDCVGVMSGPGGADTLRARDPNAVAAFPILADPNFAFWGKLGVVAAPTAVVVGADHKVRWVKAGYGYDFVAGFHAQLNKALGLTDEAEASVRVETLENASDRARRERHIRMARTLARKGRLESAIRELQRVRQLDPNATDVAFELGEFLCRAGKNEAALKVAAEAETETPSQKARALLIRAWARRQMGELETAESLLAKALELEPGSARALYELGKVYQAKGDVEKALAGYRRALAVIFEEVDANDSSQR